MCIVCRKITDGKGDVNIDAENEDGYTPLLLAAKFKNFRVFVKLWEQGAARDAEDAKKKNALHLAIEAECSEIAQHVRCYAIIYPVAIYCVCFHTVHL